MPSALDSFYTKLLTAEPVTHAEAQALQDHWKRMAGSWMLNSTPQSADPADAAWLQSLAQTPAFGTSHFRPPNRENRYTFSHHTRLFQVWCDSTQEYHTALLLAHAPGFIHGLCDSLLTLPERYLHYALDNSSLRFGSFTAAALYDHPLHGVSLHKLCEATNRTLLPSESLVHRVNRNNELVVEDPQTEAVNLLVFNAEQARDWTQIGLIIQKLLHSLRGELAKFEPGRFLETAA